MSIRRFENDVKMYGTQTAILKVTTETSFEHDVKMYGTQTISGIVEAYLQFENDVKMYGTQTNLKVYRSINGLRMM